MLCIGWRILCFSLLLLLGGSPSVHGLDWSGWISDGKSLSDSPFWDPSQATITKGKVDIEKKVEDNLAKGEHIMKLTLGPQGDPTELNVHHVYTYSPDGFEIYRRKDADFEQEQVELGQWINRVIKKDQKDQRFVSLVEKFYRKLSVATNQASWVESLQRELLAIRLGINTEVLQNHPDFERFVRNNYLFRHIPFHRHQVTVDSAGEPALLVEETSRPWSDVEKLIELDSKGRLTNYYYTYQGLVPGQPDKTVRPFKKIDPVSYHGMSILEVVSSEQFPPHNWIRLIDTEGNLYSAGFWGETPVSGLWEAVKHVVPETGKVLSPDPMEVIADPNRLKTTAIAIAPDQLNTLLKYLEGYQKDPGSYEILSSFGGENCAKFVRQVLEAIQLKIKTSSWYRPFDNPYDVIDWQNTISKWRQQQLNALDNPTEAQRRQVRYSLPD